MNTTPPGGKGKTPSELLHGSPVQSITDAAIILRLTRRNGEPNRRAVHELVKTGRLRLVDPKQPIQRWTIPSAEIIRYIGAEDGAA